MTEHQKQGRTSQRKGRRNVEAQRNETFRANPRNGVGASEPRLFVQDADFTLYLGDVRACLRELPAESVHTVVTSPPYWGLRDYGTGSWEGGNPDCDHKRPNREQRYFNGRGEDHGRGGAASAERSAEPFTDVCGKCGAARVDQQLGLEPTPEAFVAAMVDVFREVRRVLRADGTLWLNLGDSYAASSATGHGGWDGNNKNPDGTPRQNRQAGDAWSSTPTAVSGLKPKDMCGIPWRVAFALQADGWYLRSDIIWAKPNPMPESVTDRPTKAHEYVFLLTRSPRYFFDQEAVREAHATPLHAPGNKTGYRNGGQEFDAASREQIWGNPALIHRSGNASGNVGAGVLPGMRGTVGAADGNGV